MCECVIMVGGRRGAGAVWQGARRVIASAVIPNTACILMLGGTASGGLTGVSGGAGAV